MKIRTGDNVVVTTGKDKGKTGTVLRVLPLKNRVVVSGIGMRTKHMKATPQGAGQKVEYEASIAISNVMLIDPKSKKRTRVGFTVDSKGKKKRVARKSGEEITKKAIPQKKEEKASTKKADEKAPKATKEEKKTEQAAQPEKKPFWGRSKKKDPSEDEVKAPSHMQEDHSIPEEQKLQSTRSHEHHN